MTTDANLDDDTPVDNLVDDDVEIEARALGWVPSNEFRGKSDKWVDASTYLERGKSIMPILRKNNEKMEREIQALRQERINDAKKLETLEQASIAATKAAIERATRELKAQLKEAKTEGDVDRELEITEALEQVKEHERATSTSVQPVSQQLTAEQQRVNEEFEQWQSENDWYILDKEKRDFATEYGQSLLASGQKLTSTQVLRMVTKKVNDRFSNPQPIDRVSSSRSRGGSSSGSGKSYADLDADAKKECDRQAKEFVGTGDFKTNKDYQEFFAKIYFAS